ncbi:photosystem II reaction center protein Ycf12/Psb30 [Thermostichus vulcanus]|uniref:Photosystem II reaction center protein Psb30 n=1 Tax=Thermostichus vulcanus str. 'Rupite' TaxID=2813851 RepID=A0ABT0CBV5_THEVL|nr:photosystem II reaction center protein Ycf12 [Thermostichus vulcanus]MCJ2543194.1 photosystem II reaction center protein Ycf12 [Thermostichus vulcanus str. 'Rupite']
MFGQYEVFVQLALLALIVLAGPAVIFLLYLRGADM